MTAFTHYWTNHTCAEAQERGEEGLQLNHVASNIFTERGVRKGDRIYVITVIKGELFLIGRLTANRIVHSDGEAERLLCYEPWSAADHLIADADKCTTMNFRRPVAFGIVKQLRFIGPDGLTPARFKSEWALDQQTLRGVRKLSEESAALLDGVLQA
jgi:hypothetical protein